MPQAFRFQSSETDKFWIIDCAENAFCVHYGKWGAIGKYEIKEFADAAQCAAEATKLIASKQKKGYAPMKDFDFDSCLYLDAEEYSPHRLTSHPRFTAHFTDDCYYDCIDEEAPFGSDEGADTLCALEAYLRKKPGADVAAFPKRLVEMDWGMQYLPADTLDAQAVAALAKTKEMDMQQSDMVTYAAAFGQIKITGRLDAGLRERALAALKRYAVMYANGVLTETQRRMYDDLATFSAGV